jgi:hypothetical protein
LRSSKNYRQALHREFVKRRPGLYPRKWLAKRLGITKRTSQRYQHEDIIKRKAMYYRQTISWDNLAHISDMPELMGQFLQDETGKRYPPKRELAKKLLSEGHHLSYMRQDVNYYWHSDTPASPLIAMGLHPKSPEIAQKPRFATPVESWDSSIRKTPEIAQNRDDRQAPELIIEKSLSNECRGASRCAPDEVKLKDALANQKTKTKRYYRQVLPDELQENTAQRLYKKIRSRCEEKSAEKAAYISMAYARKLTEQYGMAQIRRLIQVLSWRDGIENPAGFAVVWLRSEAKRAELEQLMKSTTS